MPKLMGYSKSSYKRGVHSDECLHSEKRISNKQSNFIPQGTKEKGRN